MAVEVAVAAAVAAVVVAAVVEKALCVHRYAFPLD